MQFIITSILFMFTSAAVLPEKDIPSITSATAVPSLHAQYPIMKSYNSPVGDLYHAPQASEKGRYKSFLSSSSFSPASTSQFSEVSERIR